MGRLVGGCCPANGGGVPLFVVRKLQAGSGGPRPSPEGSILPVSCTSCPAGGTYSSVGDASLPASCRRDPDTGGRARWRLATQSGAPPNTLRVPAALVQTAKGEKRQVRKRGSARRAPTDDRVSLTRSVRHPGEKSKFRVLRLMLPRMSRRSSVPGPKRHRQQPFRSEGGARQDSLGKNSELDPPNSKPRKPPVFTEVFFHGMRRGRVECHDCHRSAWHRRTPIRTEESAQLMSISLDTIQQSLSRLDDISFHNALWTHTLARARLFGAKTPQNSFEPLKTLHRVRKAAPKTRDRRGESRIGEVRRCLLRG